MYHGYDRLCNGESYTTQDEAGGPAFDLSPATQTKGAPSFVFLKGGSKYTRGPTVFTQHDPATKSSPNLGSPRRSQVPPGDKTNNCSSADPQSGRKIATSNLFALRGPILSEAGVARLKPCPSRVRFMGGFFPVSRKADSSRCSE